MAMHPALNRKNGVRFPVGVLTFLGGEIGSRT